MNEFGARTARLLERFPGLKIDAMVVSTLENVRYLSGFTGSNALLYITPDSSTLYTDPRYTLQASQETGCRVKIARGPLADELLRTARGRTGFENARIDFALYSKLERKLKLLPAGETLEDMRMVKSGAETELIRRSVLLNSRAYDLAMAHINRQTTEKDLAAELDYRMRRLGAEQPAFDTIVATRERSTLPHAQPTSAVVMLNGLLLVDVGARVQGYCSDMTRTVHVGRPGSRVRKMYKAVLEAQSAGVSAVRAGVSAEAVDAAARKVLRLAGLGKEFVHSTGHGLGLEIHEGPRLGRKQKTRLEAGMVITIEPGAYVEGVGGIRIEDTVLVTEKGCEVLTPTPKELAVL
jgi:Xaa-Pro aminopeptidase